MKKQVNESPKLIPSSNFGLDKEDKNKYILQRLQRKKKVIDNFGGYDIYKSGSAYFVLSDDGMIGYLMITKDDKVRRLKMPFATQVIVWRIYGKALPSGLASYIFWKHLFSIHHLIMSDSQQTSDGQRFWMDQVGRALKNKLFVYVANIRTGETSKVLDTKDAFGNDVYGNEDYFKLIRIIISKYPLFEKESVEKS
jgi:hypothetical protein